MKLINVRVWAGWLLIVGGVLGLAGQLGLPVRLADWFFGLVFLLLAAVFFSRLRAADWTLGSALPAFLLLGLALDVLLPPAWEAWGGGLFLASLGCAFWLWGWTRGGWWSLLVGGVLFTLALVSIGEDVYGLNTDGWALLGVGLSFLVVAVRTEARGAEGVTWAYIPAAVLLALGALTLTTVWPLLSGLWPLALIAAGSWLLWSYFRG